MQKVDPVRLSAQAVARALRRRLRCGPPRITAAAANGHPDSGQRDWGQGDTRQQKLSQHWLSQQESMSQHGTRQQQQRRGKRGDAEEGIPLAQMDELALENAIIAAHARANAVRAARDDADAYVWSGEDEADEGAYSRDAGSAAEGAYSENADSAVEAATGQDDDDSAAKGLPQEQAEPGAGNVIDPLASTWCEVPQVHEPKPVSNTAQAPAPGVPPANAGAPLDTAGNHLATQAPTSSGWSPAQQEQWWQWYSATVSTSAPGAPPQHTPSALASASQPLAEAQHRQYTTPQAHPAGTEGGTVGEGTSAAHAANRASEPGWGAGEPAGGGLVMVPAVLLRRYQELEWAEWRRRWQHWQAECAAYEQWYQQYTLWWQEWQAQAGQGQESWS